MKYLGNLTEDQVIDFHFSTHKSDGTPITLAGTPVVKVYKANATGTESTAGVTLDVDFDSVTGLHHVRIDTSADAFYAIANDYSIVITTGTVDSISVVGTVLAVFSIENRYGDATDAVATLDGSTFTALPAVTLANGAHGGAAATLQMASSTLGATTMINASGVGLTITGSTTGLVVTGTASRGVQIQGHTLGLIIDGEAGGGVFISGTTSGLTVYANAGPALYVYGYVTANNESNDIELGTNTLSDIKTALEAAGGSIALILADTAELQADWADGGRLDVLLDAAVSNAGTGARTVTITVNDGTDVLESASVRLTKGAESYIQSTSVAGVATFNVDDGTWTVAITLAGYTYSGTTIVVNGDETATYSMTETAISAPASPSCTTGYVLCLGTDGLPEAGVSIKAQMTDGPGTAGYALDRGTITMTSGVDGVAQHSGFVRGAWYKFKRGSDSWWGDAQQAPDASEWSLAEIVGQP